MSIYGNLNSMLLLPTIPLNMTNTATLPTNTEYAFIAKLNPNVYAIIKSEVEAHHQWLCSCYLNSGYECLVQQNPPHAEDQ